MRMIAWVLGCLCVFQAMSFGITLEAIYTGTNGGNWSTASNWDVNVVPIDQAAVISNVTIPAGKAVVFNVSGDSQINNFTLNW